jgi:hypothetical protein
MTLKDFWDWLLGLLGLERKTQALNEEIDALVQEVSPSIFNVRGYRKALRLPLELAKNYIERLVEAIPGPLPLSVIEWGRGTSVELLFIDPDQVRELFQGSADLKTFFQNDPASRIYALLIATCNEKTIFGSEVQGEILRRDVPQEAVDFKDHRIVVPAPTQNLNCLKIKEGALRLLALRAMEPLADLKNQAEDLSEEKRITEVKLKILQAQSRSLEGLLETDQESRAKADQVRKILDEIDRELVTVKTRLGGAREALNHLRTVLQNPEEILKYQRLTFRLNWMGVKVNEEAADPGKIINLIEVEIKDRLKRVAVLITVNREEVLNQT